MKTSIRRRLVTWTLPLLLIITANAMTPQPAAADVDVYITPGNHTVAGRQWRTACAKYSSQVTRCRAEIKAHQVKLVNGRYANTFGWVFNNLTYKAAPRAHWSNNNLGKTATWTENGRRWYTECDTPQTGFNGCRSYIWATSVVVKGKGFQQIEGWVFNNMVRFSSDKYGEYSGTGNATVTLPKGANEVYVKGDQVGQGTFIVQGVNSRGAVTEVAFTETDSQPDQVGGVIGIVNKDTVRLEVKADGLWFISVHPISIAQDLMTRKSNGTGSEALWYHGPAKQSTLTHTGSSRIVVRTWVGKKSTVVVDTVGAVSTRLNLPAGSTLIQISTDGQWSIT